jgi:hypothetical protein
MSHTLMIPDHHNENGDHKLAQGYLVDLLNRHI